MKRLNGFTLQRNGGVPTEPLPIIGVREEGGVLSLQIKWKVADPEEFTWEPFDRVYEDAPRLVQRFLRSCGKGVLREKAEFLIQRTT